MSKKKDEPTTEDVMAAAIEANFRAYERQTGNPREVMLSQMSDRDRRSAQEAQDHHAARMRRAGRAGW